MKLLGTGNIAGSQFIVPKFAADLYEAFLLRLTGTQAPAAAMTVGEVGRIKYTEHGRPIVDCDFDMLHFYNELKGGDIELTGEAATNAFAYSCLIPRHFQDGVVHAITADDEPQFVLQFGPNAVAGIASGTCDLYGIPRESGEQPYRLKISQRDFPISGASTPVEHILEENVLGLYFDRAGLGPNNTAVKASYGVDADWTDLVIKKDGKDLISSSVGALQAKSNAYNRIEASYSRLFEAEMVSDRVEISEALSDDIELAFRTTGAVTIRCLVLSADFTDDKHAATQLGSAEVLRAKLQRKQASGKTRPGRVAAQIIAGA